MPSTQPSADQLTLGTHLEDVMNAGDVAASEATFDYDELTRRVTQGLTLTAAQRSNAVDHDGQFAFVGGIKQNGNRFHLLRIRLVDGEWRALYRTIGADGGFNYNEYVLVLNKNHEWRFADLYTTALGELQSSINRRLLVTEIAIDAGKVAGLSPYERCLVDNATLAGNVSKEEQAGHYEQAIAFYHQLPVTLQHGRLFEYLRLVSAAHTIQKNPLEYKQAADEFNQLFPHDPFNDMVNYRALVAARDFKQLEGVLDRLQQYTGGDAYLLWIKGHNKVIQAGEGNLRAAKASFEQAIQQEPSLAKPYFAMIDLSLNAKNYDETATLLDQLEKNTGSELRDLREVPAYAEFVRSEAYHRWWEKQPRN